MGLLKHLRKRIDKAAYCLENRRLRRIGLRRSRGEREYPETPGTLDGIDPDHIFRYEWARPFCFGKKVLDYGCGVGYGSHLLADGARHVLGYDVSAEALAWAKHYAKDRANLAYASDLPHERFDYVVCFECIEHAADPEAAIDWIADHTIEYLFISTPEGRPGKKWSAFHNVEFSREEFMAVLRKRFEIEHVEDQITKGCKVLLVRCRRPSNTPRVSSGNEAR